MALQLCSSLSYSLNLCLSIFKSSLTGNSLDTANTSSNTSFADNLEHTNLTYILYVRTATQLLGEVCNRYNANYIAILLTKESHCTGINCFILAHMSDFYIGALQDFTIY